jgi:ATP-dependent DNA ligase
MLSPQKRGARVLTLPLVEPIVPVARGVPFDDPAYLFEPKYDGFRGLLYVTRRDCHFRSKRGNVLRKFQELGCSVREELRVKKAILGGREYQVVLASEDGSIHCGGAARSRGDR